MILAWSIGTDYLIGNLQILRSCFNPSILFKGNWTQGIWKLIQNPRIEKDKQLYLKW